MKEKIHTISGIDICSDSFGNPAHPAILLIMGATCSMVYWDEEFCQRLADTGRFVIRYDNRDTGRSTTYEPGTAPYTVADMADDAIGVLDAYGISQAHLVGMSLGGMIAQIMAVKHPMRVLSITLHASGFYGPAHEVNEAELPPMDEEILAHHARGAALDWSDEEAVADYLVAGSRMLCGSKHVLDEARTYRQVKAEIKRARNLLSMFNHALLQENESYEVKVADIRVPTLVIHGTDDTILPYQHGVVLARELQDAKLITLEGTGHELHPDDWETIIKAIAAHTAS